MRLKASRSVFMALRELLLTIHLHRNCQMIVSVLQHNEAK
jgi:hypothetical protein